MAKARRSKTKRSKTKLAKAKSSKTKRGNRQYKDTLFRFIFGYPENKEWVLSLYNAINGTNYTDANAIVFNTIANAVYMGMKNDVSFIVYNTMNFYEQQSTYNPNMPMRFMFYAGMAYGTFVLKKENRYYGFSSAKQKAPTPKCVCFYNGTTEMEDRKRLYLSDSFDGDPDIEVKVTMININYGHNRELLEACRPLKEYSYFVDRTRFHNQTEESLEDSLDAALRDLPDDSLIKAFLLKNQAEVKHMFITEYDQARAFAEQREEGRAEGIAEGIEIGVARGRTEGIEIGVANGRTEGIEIGVAKGTLNLLMKLVENGTFSVSEAAKMAEMPLFEFETKTGLKAKPAT